MKTALVLFTLFVAAFAGHIYEHHHLKHPEYFDEHIPFIGKDGVPLDTLEVREAKRQHAAAHAEIKHREHHLHGLPELHEHFGHFEEPAHLHHGNKQLHTFAPNHYHHRRRRSAFPHHFGHEEHIPIIGKDGVPLDTPEVQLAKEEHFLAVAHAKQQASYHKALEHQSEHFEDFLHEDPHSLSHLHSFDEHLHEHTDYSTMHHGHSEDNYKLIHNGKHPVDTYEVQSAKARHFAAHLHH